MQQQFQPRIDIDQQEGWLVIVDYYPTGHPAYRYTVGKLPNQKNPSQLEPAMLKYGGPLNWANIESTTEHIGYLGMMVNLALQLDRLVQSPEDLKRKIIVRQTGLGLTAQFEEEADVS